MSVRVCCTNPTRKRGTRESLAYASGWCSGIAHGEAAHDGEQRDSHRRRRADRARAVDAALAGQGYDLAFAPSGAEALAQAAAAPPDLVLLDVMMPSMDGFEVLRRIRADAALAEVPVILVTALDDRDARLTGFEAGADDFLSKPIDRAEVRARVRTITRLNRYRRLLQERGRFQRLFEFSPDGILITDLGGTIKQANPAAGRLLRRPEALAGVPLPDLFGGDGDALLACLGGCDGSGGAPARWSCRRAPPTRACGSSCWPGRSRSKQGRRCRLSCTTSPPGAGRRIGCASRLPCST